MDLTLSLGKVLKFKILKQDLIQSIKYTNQSWTMGIYNQFYQTNIADLTVVIPNPSKSNLYIKCYRPFISPDCNFIALLTGKQIFVLTTAEKFAFEKFRRLARKFCVARVHSPWICIVASLIC